MTFPTLEDAERAFARTETTPTPREWYIAETHAACVVGACVIERYGPVERNRYAPLMAELYGVSTGQVESLAAGFDHGIRGVPFDAASFSTPAFRRGVEIGQHIRDLYGAAVLA